MTDALRSPGSTLKPFIYGMAFEDGLIHPETLIDDKPQRFGSYKPENFDLTFQGTVTVRRALQWSLNVPAIAVLNRVGVSRLDARLTQAGAALVLPQDEAPGLAMGLGGVGIRLSDLVMLYTGLARLGTVVPLIERVGEKPARPAPAASIPVAAWYVGNILIGAPPPENAPPGRIAFKTGTSYGYRDAWAVGFDGRMTIGVWVGRPDGTPVPGLVGRASAAPILFDAFARTGSPRRRCRRRPRGCCSPPPASCRRPCSTSTRTRPWVRSRAAPRIMFPPNGARLELAGPRDDPEPVALKLAGGRGRAHGHGQWRAAAGAARAPDRVLPARRARLRAADGDGRPRRQRQRHGAAAITRKPANDSPGAWLSFCFVAFPDGEPVSTSPGNALWSAPTGGPESSGPDPDDERDQQRRAAIARPGARPGDRARLCHPLARRGRWRCWCCSA